MTDITAPAVSGQGTDTTASTDTTAATSIDTNSVSASNTIGWLTDAPEDITGFVRNKGWNTPIDAIISYKQLEKFVGTPADKLLRLPDFDKGDKHEIDQFYNKLGRPVESNKYEIPVPENVDPAFAEAAKLKFHELGITARQAKALAEWNNEFATQTINKHNEAYNQAITAENNALKKEWGQAYEQEMNMAFTAARALGLTSEKIDKLKQSIGFADTMKMMANIGKRVGEDKYVDGEGSGGNVAMTPAMAREKINNARNDKEFQAKLIAGNASAKAEWDRWHGFLQ